MKRNQRNTNSIFFKC